MAMQSLEKRIAELEAKGFADATDHIMFIHFVGMDEEEQPIQRIHGGVREWSVMPGETDETFKARVLNEDADRQPAKGCIKCYNCDSWM